MRTTSLDFRSPKERTPGFYMPEVLMTFKVQLMYNGQKACFPLINTKQNYRPNFNREKRFYQYSLDAKRTNVVVSPATYDFSEYALRNTRGKCLVSPLDLILIVETFMPCKNCINRLCYVWMPNNI